MTQDIELYSKIQNPVEAIERIGSFLAKSGMFGCERTEQGMVLAMACMTERKSPLEIKRRFHLVGGELSMRADAMLADLRSRGGKHKVLSRTADRAAIELTYDGQTQSFSFTWDEAKAEPFVYGRDGRTIKTNYATPWQRKKMLWARVISDAVHTMAPEVATGIYTPEELDDTPQTTNQSALLAPAAPQTTVIDVNPTPAPSNETQTPPPTPPPASTVAAAAAPDPDKSKASAVIARIDPQTGRLTAETIQALQNVIGEENAALALTWLEANKRIPAQGSLFDLSLARAKAILEKPQAFLKAIGTPVPGTAPKNGGVA
jgi:hypothetical protein